MTYKKKIACKIITYTTIGLAFIGSSLLVNPLVNNHTNHKDLQQNTVAIKEKITNATNQGNITKASQNFTIRSNPSNGFNGLTTPDGKYTYVLITRKYQEALTPETVGGYNSGIACIDNTTGNVIGEPWYLPIGYAFKNNYTTNIVFGQTEYGGFDQNKLFVLCGISNLAAAINSVYTGYDTNTHILTTQLDQGPTIKIFSLSISLPGTFTNALGTNAFYNFTYPSDGKNGYAGFNNDGAYYQISANVTGDYNEVMPDSLKKTNYLAWGVNFEAYDKKTAPNGIKRTNPAWENGKGFQPMYNDTIGAFNSYLTYLTFGQNFAYHYNVSYQNLDDKTIHHDEFLMSTAFVNVDQNIGGLYSAFVNYQDWGDDDEPLYPSYTASYALEQKDWPMPFSYIWLLASLAFENQTEHQDPQYTYVSSDGTKHPVNWDSSLALNQPVVDFLNDKIFVYGFFADKGALYNRFIRDDFLTGASWNATTGYLIFNPKASTTTPSAFDNKTNVNEYRYYYVPEFVDSPFTDNDAKIFTDKTIYFSFTNLLATDQLSPNGSISYLVDMVWNFAYVHRPVLPSFGNLTRSSMFCYDWNSLSDDDQDNAMVESLAPQLNNLSFGYYNDYMADAKKTNNELKASFQNWNLVFLGAPSQEGIKQMDSSFSNDYWTFDIDGALRDYYSRKKSLGKRLTYLRRKISFVIFPYRGFVYFTQGTGIEWQMGFSIWDVRGSDYLSLYHDFNRTNDVYLSNPIWKVWNECDDAVWAIKPVNKQVWGDGGSSLLFITSKGVYSVAGANTIDYLGSPANVLVEGGMPSGNFSTSRNPNLLNAISYTPFPTLKPATNVDSLSSYGPIVDNVAVLNTNFLWVLQPTPIAYSVQQNTDYLIDQVVENKYIPKELINTPAAKPLLPVDDVTWVKASDIQPDLKNEQGHIYTLLDIMKIKLDRLFRYVLNIVDSILPFGCKTNANYDAGLHGFFIESVDPVNNIKAKIGVPVTYHTKLHDINPAITYFAPIVQDDGSYELFYLLTGLEKSEYAQPIVVLQDTMKIINYLNENKLTAVYLANKYGGNTYNQTIAKEFHEIFVDKQLTDEYIKKYEYLKDYDYWLWPTITSDGKLGIWVKYKLPLKGIKDWTISQDGIQSGICLFTNFTNGQPHNLQSTYSFEGYLPPLTLNVGSELNAKLIIGIVVGVICGIALLLGLGIGIPMRKQHKINILNSKITNKRIDKLSSAVAISFKKVIQTTSEIGKDVHQLRGEVHQTFGNNQIGPSYPTTNQYPTRPITAPVRPGNPPTKQYPTNQFQTTPVVSTMQHPTTKPISSMTKSVFPTKPLVPTSPIKPTEKK